MFTVGRGGGFMWGELFRWRAGAVQVGGGGPLLYFFGISIFGDGP